MTVHDQKSFLPAITDQATHFFAPLQREIDRVFNEFSRGVAANDMFAPSPDMDLVETAEGVELTVELPGLKSEDVSVTIEDGILTVAGEKRSETDETRKGYRLVERRYGSFSRSIKLPAGVIADQMKATLDQGVLKVTAPREKGTEGRKVPIEVGKA